MLSSNCTLDIFPVSISPLGYQPDLGAKVAGAVLFILCFILQVSFGLKWHTWSYLVAMGCGCAAEAIGYAGRLMLYQNPFSKNGFTIEIATLTFAPAFLAAGIYLNLKHIVVEFGPEYSRLKPQQYTWIFVCCDIVSIFVQAFGAGYSAMDNANETIASDVVLCVLSTQVFTLGAFGAVAVEFFYHERHGLAFPVEEGSWRKSCLNTKSATQHKTRRFKLFTGALLVAFVTILIRCIYRVAVGANGWKGPLMQNQGPFIGLDEAMCAIATIRLSVLHPGYCLRNALGVSDCHEHAADSEQGSRLAVPPPHPKHF